MTRPLRTTALVAALCLLLVACVGEASDESERPDDVTAGGPTASETESATAESGGSTEDVEPATVKITSQGTFVDPQVGEQLNAAGVGTGFIIDPEGTVVTNNHVVGGAALLRVTVPGRDDPVNARVLGGSECSDLAVIDLAGDGYPYLEFRSEEVRPGLDVFAAGYPATDETELDDVNYTLTSGIISAAATAGETGWASVDEVLEHDARIRGGNSGGPLVDEQGRVVGINYAASDETDQNFAIAVDDAAGIIELLRRDEDVESIGVNGQAVVDDEAEVSGVWVASVASGSPADEAGVEPGDIITQLEGLQLATDGTMSDYCDILRTKGPDAVMALEVLRYETQEVLEGQLNGDPLEQSFSFAQEFEEEVPDQGGGGVTPYASFTPVTDDTGALTVEVPAEWSDTNTEVNPNFGPSVYAAPDLDRFINSWDVPGIIVEISTEQGAAGVDAALDEMAPSSCTSAGRESLQDGTFDGGVELWTDCGGTDTILAAASIAPQDGSFLVRILGQAVNDRDLQAMDHAIRTLDLQP